MPRGFTSIVILLGIAFIILIGGVVVYQKVMSPQASQMSSPILTPTITTTPSSISQVSPTPDPTAGWKAFTTTYLGSKISLKYPTGWRELRGDVGPITILNSIGTSELHILAINRNKNVSISANIHTFFETQGSFGKQNLKYIDEGQAIINGNLASIAEISTTVDGIANKMIWAFIEAPKDPNYLFVVNIYPFSEDDRRIFPLILSTFKFLD